MHFIIKKHLAYNVRTTSPTMLALLQQKPHLLSLNVILHVLITGGPMAYYNRDSSDDKETATQTLQMTTWSARSLLVTGCD